MINLRVCNVYVSDILCGKLCQTDEGYTFNYLNDYLNNYNKPVSLTLPLSSDVFFSKTLFSFFDGLIPEGWMLEKVIDKWKLKFNNRFEILMVSGKDPIGNVTVMEVKDELSML